MRGENGLKPKQKITAIIVGSSGFLEILSRNSRYRRAIQTLAGVETLLFEAGHDKQPGETHGIGMGFEVFANLEGAIDVGQERERLAREISKLRPQVDKLHAKLANPGFVDKAPAAVVEKNRAELAGLQAQLDKLSQSLTQLGT